MIVIGIDPGINGGIAVIDGDHAEVVDMPVTVRKIGRRSKKRVDPEELARVLVGLAQPGCAAFVERSQASPRMGAVSAFCCGEGFGMVLGVLAQLGVETRLVSPVAWKRDMGLIIPGSRELGRNEARDKAPALELARRLYPQLADRLSRAKDDGRADALLLAHWGAEQIEGAIAA